MQRSLFEENQQPIKKRELLISAKKTKRLNPEQNAFNRLIKKIEKLRSQIEKTSANLDEKLANYGKEIYPVEVELNTVRKELIRQIYPYFTKSKAIKGQKRQTLKRFLQSFLDKILFNESDSPEADIKEIYQEVFNMSYEQASAEEFEEMKEGWKDYFKREGFDANLDELKENMSQDEINAKLKEFFEKIGEQVENKTSQKSNQKKSEKQLEKENKEKQMAGVRNKNINSIYRQLAKVLHPDLEQDESLKLQKQVLMQRLTVAYKERDLHALLSLELEWIQKEENNIEELTNEKLVIYNQVLKDQIKDLEMQKNNLELHPRYSPLMRYCDNFGLRLINISAIQSELKSMINSMNASLKQLQGKGALKEVRHIINVFEISEMENEFGLYDEDGDEWDDGEWDF
ncbi:MAG: hypothetical protein ABI123_07600 [Ginsengibacter sp.]|jgi:uncharacterized protein (DUF2267 family)